MTDDIVARLRETTARMGRECSVPNFDLWNDHSNACLGVASRLEAAEARVRELEAERDKWDRRVAYDELQAREHENRATQQHQIDALTIRAEAAERALAEAYERAASKCEELQQVFLSDEYALDQPQSSFGERYACGRCAEEIRNLAQEDRHAKAD